MTNDKHTPGASTGEKIHDGITGVFSRIHGMGEAIRGNFNGAVDHSVGSKDGAAKNDAIAHKGEDEMKTGKFQAKDMEPTTQADGKML